MKLKEEIERLRRIAPLSDKRTGQLYAKPARGMHPRHAAYKKITLYTLFVSDEKDMMIRPHVFKKKEPKTPAGWRAWLNEHVDEIMTRDVLGGLSRVTGDLSKQWAVVEYIGWIGDAKYKSDDSSAHRRRNKAGKKGRSRG